jgi:predicted nucleic acid-binding protein
MRRYYVDTSVFGGCFDEGWIEASVRFLNFVRSGRIVVVTSDIVDEELLQAPQHVRDLTSSLPPSSIERVEVSDAVGRLRDAYLEAGVLGKRSVSDATHVALASVARVDAIVSWNFRDLVRDDRIRGFNRVNLAEGYGLIMVVSPHAVRFDDDQEG